MSRGPNTENVTPRGGVTKWLLLQFEECQQRGGSKKTYVILHGGGVDRCYGNPLQVMVLITLSVHGGAAYPARATGQATMLLLSLST